MHAEAAGAVAREEDAARLRKAARDDVEGGREVLCAAKEEVAIAVVVDVPVPHPQGAVTVGHVPHVEGGRGVGGVAGAQEAEGRDAGRCLLDRVAVVGRARAAALQEDQEVLAAPLSRGHGELASGEADRSALAAEDVRGDASRQVLRRGGREGPEVAVNALVVELLEGAFSRRRGLVAAAGKEGRQEESAREKGMSLHRSGSPWVWARSARHRGREPLWGPDLANP